MKLSKIDTKDSKLGKVDAKLTKDKKNINRVNFSTNML